MRVPTCWWLSVLALGAVLSLPALSIGEDDEPDPGTLTFTGMVDEATPIRSHTFEMAAHTEATIRLVSLEGSLWWFKIGTSPATLAGNPTSWTKTSQISSPGPSYSLTVSEPTRVVLQLGKWSHAETTYKVEVQLKQRGDGADEVDAGATGENAMPIASGADIAGHLTGHSYPAQDSIDMYRVDLAEGATIRVELEALDAHTNAWFDGETRLDRTDLNMAISIYRIERLKGQEAPVLHRVQYEYAKVREGPTKVEWMAPESCELWLQVSMTYRANFHYRLKVDATEGSALRPAVRFVVATEGGFEEPEELPLGTPIHVEMEFAEDAPAEDTRVVYVEFEDGRRREFEAHRVTDRPRLFRTTVPFSLDEEE